MHDKETMQRLFKSLREKRTRAINALGIDPMLGAIIYDHSMAPETTNIKMLEMIGIDTDLATLDEIIEGLAKWEIYLVNTNHLSDEELHNRLLNRILQDPTRLIPPNKEMFEVLDLNMTNKVGPNKSNRDASLPRPSPRPSNGGIVVHA